MQVRDIQPGQRFQLDTGFVWEVKRTTALKTVPRQFIIVGVNDPTTSKIILEIVHFEPPLCQPVRQWELPIPLRYQ